MKRYIVQRSNKAEIRPKEQSEKVDSCRETLSNEIQLKGPYRQKQTRKKKKIKKKKKSGHARLVYVEGT